MPVDNDLLQRVRDELAAEEISEHEIWEIAEHALRALVARIAKRLKRRIEEIWEALRVLGGGRR